MSSILQAMPLLSCLPSTPFGFPGALQLLIFGFQIMWQELRFETCFAAAREEVVVALPGESAGAHTDRVAVQWLHAEKGAEPRDLPDDAPVVLICPGLNCYAASLPGTSLYQTLLARPWRVGVFEKRGVGALGARGLRAPAFHLFGHPSDLHVVVMRVRARWPEAPIHLVGLSSGNGLAGSYATMYGEQVPALRSCLLLIGGEDYNCAFEPPRGTWLTRFLFNKVLLEVTKSRFLRRNTEVLRRHSKEGYEAALAAPSLQELYDLTMMHFSGYSDRAEAEQQINGFSGSNRCLLRVAVPVLVVYTEDDPVAPGGPREEWLDVISQCERAAIALFPSGSHLGCYDGWQLSRWVDRLVAEWVEAAEVCFDGCRVGESPVGTPSKPVKTW